MANAKSADLSFEEILLARAVFAKQTDTKLRSVHQLRSMLSDLGQYPSQAELDTVMDSFNQKMRFEDFAKYLEFLKRSFMKPEAKDADTVRAFVALGGSHDRNGEVIADDLRNTCHKFGLTIDIDAMLREVDEDGSGALEYGEFKSMWDEDECNVSFHVEEESASETEYLTALREFLVTQKKDPEAEARLPRQNTMTRRRSKASMDVSRRGTNIRLPPVNTAASVSSPNRDSGDEGAADEDDAPRQTHQTEPVRQQGSSDPAYRRYMMTDPVVVGSRRGGSKPTPRGALPVVTPRSGRRPRAGSPMSSSRGSPHKTM